MNNSCSERDLSPHQILEQSDSETIQHASHTYDYLLSFGKSFSSDRNFTSLNQLQIQKNSKKQAILSAQNQIRQSYEIEINNLNNKIQSLESAAAKRNLSVVLKTQISSSQLPPKRQSRLLKRSCSRQLNRSVSKQSKNNLSSQNNQFSIQSKMYRKKILENSIWQGQFIEQFEQLIRKQTEQIQIYVQNLSDLDQNFDHHYQSVQSSQNVYFIENRILQLESVIKKQNKLIIQMQTYQSQLEQLLKTFTYRINENLQQKLPKKFKLNLQHQLTQVIEAIIQVLDKWKQKNKNKEMKYQEENKQLRQIVEEMIVLVHKKKNNSGNDYRTKLM